MSFLLDTHVLLWWLVREPRLSPAAADAIESGREAVYVSAATAWEITTKHRIGKLPSAAALAADISGHLSEEGFVPLAITVAHASRAGRLAFAHKDPFDRLLIAQASMEDLTLVSNERAFDAFGVSRLW